VTQASLRGCIPILCTPFFEDQSIDHASLAREVDWVIGEGASGVAALAIASEGYKLTEPERDAVVETVVRAVANRVTVVASADGAGTAVAVDRARRAVQRGADAVMVLPPYFMKPDAAGLRDYYLRVADAAGGATVIVQDAPQLTGVAMSPAQWAAWSAENPSIAVIKAEGTPQGRVLSETVRLGEGRLSVFCGWGGLGMIDALERGAAGSMPAPNFTRLYAGIQERFEAGDRGGAEALFAGRLPFVLWTMQSVEFSVATAKEALRRAGVFETNTTRSPSTPLDAISADQLDRWLSH
jgi:2-keto-3-deoxy-L-arabinonate dehydratase